MHIGGWMANWVVHHGHVGAFLVHSGSFVCLRLVEVWPHSMHVGAMGWVHGHARHLGYCVGLLIRHLGWVVVVVGVERKRFERRVGVIDRRVHHLFWWCFIWVEQASLVLVRSLILSLSWELGSLGGRVGGEETLETTVWWGEGEIFGLMLHIWL